MFVYIPVNSTECFPTAVEVISILDIRIRFAEVTETGPYLQVFGNVVTRVQLYQHLRNFSNDIAGGIDTRCCPVTKSHSRFILLILRALVSEQEIEGKIAHLSVERPEKLTQIARALSSPLRIEVLKAISERSMNVGELAQKLDVPMSTMALGLGDGSEMMQPMAIVTEGGLIYGTLLTLFVVPCIYDAFNREKNMVEEEL